MATILSYLSISGLSPLRRSFSQFLFRDVDKTSTIRAEYMFPLPYRFLGETENLPQYKHHKWILVGSLYGFVGEAVFYTHFLHKRAPTSPSAVRFETPKYCCISMALARSAGG